MVAGCTTTSIDTAIQQSLPKTCALIETTHVAFLTVAATGEVSEKTVKREQAAYDSAMLVCADPSNVTAANALIIAAQAYVIITQALKE